ncbi:hypothetical protein [Burkholderia ubonensis]|uniref:hypothetical protein n=1 Tax=Burkholderia ubonensis TaxID=101571 RepID=UPI000F56D02C|nr:hypothetical protein [Burkholderia ubonensis]
MEQPINKNASPLKLHHLFNQTTRIKNTIPRASSKHPLPHDGKSSFVSRYQRCKFTHNPISGRRPSNIPRRAIRQTDGRQNLHSSRHVIGIKRATTFFPYYVLQVETTTQSSNPGRFVFFGRY